jgi:hypothetical protein
MRTARVALRSRRSPLLAALFLAIAALAVGPGEVLAQKCAQYRTTVWYDPGPEVPCYYPIIVKANFGGGSDTRTYTWAPPNPPGYYDVWNNSVGDSTMTGAVVTFPGGQNVTVPIYSPWPPCPLGTEIHVSGTITACPGLCYDIDIRANDCNAGDFCPHIHIRIYPCPKLSDATSARP